uniref:Uncharacterized protein n=1 Tax=Cacopsylla melanoneura TaxID=428564 RepID=A0A8D8WLL2_9HEMI
MLQYLHLFIILWKNKTIKNQPINKKKGNNKMISPSQMLLRLLNFKVFCIFYYYFFNRAREMRKLEKQCLHVGHIVTYRWDGSSLGIISEFYYFNVEFVKIK